MNPPSAFEMLPGFLAPVLGCIVVRLPVAHVGAAALESASAFIAPHPAVCMILTVPLSNTLERSNEI
jgi:hypothetical protein